MLPIVPVHRRKAHGLGKEKVIVTQLSRLVVESFRRAISLPPLYALSKGTKVVLVDIGRGVCFQSLGALLSSHPFWIAMSSPPTLTVTVEPVTDPADLPDLASIFDVATIASTDKFREALMRYVDDPYKETMEHLQAA